MVIQTWAAEKWLEAKTSLGESPTYNINNDIFYFVDINNKKLFWLHPHERWEDRKELLFEQPISCLNLVQGTDDILAVAGRLGFALLNTLSGELTTLKDIHDIDSEIGLKVRCNDGEIDSHGRFWVGTMDAINEKDPVGSLWRLDRDGSLRQIVNKSICPNGMAWSMDDKLMYWTESPHGIIYQFDFNAESGNVINQRPFVEIDTQDGKFVPDGLCMDIEGCLWSAINGQGIVNRYNPQGTLIGQVTVPAKTIACPCFGGRDMKTLFITSLDNGEPEAGNVFKVDVGIKGRQKFPYLINA